MPMLRFLLALLIHCLMLPLSVQAESWQVESDDKQKAVIELFTAEGCGLCPAAERWVKALPERGITDEELIVLGFHVDYLNDKKNWVDRFAKPLFSERQRQLARINLYQTVFTPEFFFSGEVLHDWQKYGIEAIHHINGLQAEADIQMQADLVEQQLSVSTGIEVSGTENRQYAKLYLAITEDNIRSEIGGGDNIGAIFNHQNLVRTWLGPFDLKSEGKTQINTQLMLDPEWKLHDLSVVAVVQNLNDGYTLQAVSMPLTD
jgi:hypothetical protein